MAKYKIQVTQPDGSKKIEEVDGVKFKFEGFDFFLPHQAECRRFVHSNALTERLLRGPIRPFAVSGVLERQENGSGTSPDKTCGDVWVGNVCKSYERSSAVRSENGISDRPACDSTKGNRDSS